MVFFGGEPPVHREWTISFKISMSAVASVITPTGRAAVATIELKGDISCLDRPHPLFAAINGRSTIEQPINRICFGHWGSKPSEEVVVCRTRSDNLEIHCHGGRAAVQRIISDLRERHVRIVDPWELTESETAWLEQECLRTLAKTTTRRTAEIVVNQSQGVLRSTLESLRGISDLSAFNRKLANLMKWSEFGIHLTEPWSIVICGLPNAGKSSLMNRLVGYGRSIVFHEPGTTRDVVTARTALQGWIFELADTAGIRRTENAIESEGVLLAQARLDRADLVLLVCDRSIPGSPKEQQLMQSQPRALIVANKTDLPDRRGNSFPPGTVHVSAQTGEGMDLLVQSMMERLVPEVPSQEIPIPISRAIVKRLHEIALAIEAADSSRISALWKDLLDPPE